MKKHTLRTFAVVIALAGVGGMAVGGCTGSSQKDTSAQTNAAAQKDVQAVHYTCPMHPEVLQDKPGDCPKCGMKLVEKR